MMRPRSRRRGRRREFWSPAGMGDDYWRGVKSRASEVMRSFDCLPPGMREHIRETNDPRSYKPPPMDADAAMRLLLPGVRMYVLAAGVTDAALIYRDGAFVLERAGRGVPLFTLEDMRSGAYKATFGSKVNAAIDHLNPGS